MLHSCRNKDKQKSSGQRANDAPLAPIERGGPMPTSCDETNHVLAADMGCSRLPRISIAGLAQNVADTGKRRLISIKG
jgi:hypothetical protein